MNNCKFITNNPLIFIFKLIIHSQFDEDIYSFNIIYNTTKIIFVTQKNND